MGLSVFPAPSAGVTQKVDVFTSTGTWTAPSNCSAVQIFMVGGGGGGGAIRSNGSTSNMHGGGGGGGQVIQRTLAVTPGSSYTITIGAGGAGGNLAAGAVGGDTTFGSLATAYGGGGGGYWDGYNTMYYAPSVRGTSGGSYVTGSTSQLWAGRAGDGAGGLAQASQWNYASESFGGTPFTSATMFGSFVTATETPNNSAGFGITAAGVAVDGYGGGGAGGSSYDSGAGQNYANLFASAGYTAGGRINIQGFSGSNGSAATANTGHGGGGGAIRTNATDGNALGGNGGSGYCRITYWS